MLDALLFKILVLYGLIIIFAHPKAIIVPMTKFVKIKVFYLNYKEIVSF